MKGRANELRCFCRRRPLLGTFGVKNDIAFVHGKIYKQDRIYGEFHVEGGIVKLRCRECGRWTTINMRGSMGTLTETQEPDLLVTDPIHD